MAEGEGEPGGKNGRWEKGKCHVGELRLVIRGEPANRNFNKPMIQLKNVATALLWLALAGRLAAQENAYDVLGKALMPIANVFAADSPNHALVLDAHLLEASRLPAQLQGQSVHAALMTPDALLVQAPIAGQILTVCRDGDSLWATPGSKIQYLLDQATTDAPDTKKKKKRKAEAEKVLGPLVLPVPQKDLVFLPVLFQVADAGNDTVAGAPCRTLDVQLMPQLAKSLHGENWTARLWIGADYGIVRIALTGPDWSGTVAIDKLAFSPDLPEATFQPQGTDVLKLTAAQFVDLLGRLGRQ